MNRAKPRWFKRKVLMVFGALSAIATGAFAAILISALMTGSLTTVAKPTLTWNASSTNYPVKQLSTDGSGIACSPTVASGKLNVDITNAMPGSSCEIQGFTKASADNLKVQGLTMNGVDVEFVDTNAESSASFYNKKSYVCGETLGQHNATSGTKLDNMPFVLKLTVPQDATAGTKPLTGQIDAVPSAQFDPALCTN